ncbi:MAG: hypothetical protein KDK03_11015 [Rhodobacteraceae bacterium]|nr:hypothetical protein [Paracoccaceae bacterium]
MGELHKEKLDALVQLGMLLCPEETVGAILEGTQEVLRHIADDVAAELEAWEPEPDDADAARRLDVFRGRVSGAGWRLRSVRERLADYLDAGLLPPSAALLLLLDARVDCAHTLLGSVGPLTRRPVQ